jgi:hypothetical protein
MAPFASPSPVAGDTPAAAAPSWLAASNAALVVIDAWARWQADLLHHNRLPLSGDVTQWIHAWGEAVGQVGFFNVNLAGAGNPAMEREISSRYSYGRQLGRVLDLLAPLVNAHAATLSAQVGAEPVQAFQRMVSDIARLKGDARTAAQIADEVERSWRGSAQYEQQLRELVQRLQALLPAQAPLLDTQVQLELGHA